MMTAEQLKNSILLLAMQGKLTNQTQAERVSKRFTPVEGDSPFEIPETWVWTGANNCGEIVVGATPKTSRNDYWSNGSIKWLASGCCQDCQVFDTDKNLKMITQAGYASCSTKLMPVNTVLIALTGATAGKVGLLKTVACANQSVVGITTVEELLPEYLFYHLMSRRNEILDDCKGSAQPHISKKYITEMLFAVPPLAEQKRIVEKIEELMPFVEQYAAASSKLNTLNATFPEMMKKSILQEAVQGKLVPQDPNDEPASLLLKKIAEEKKRLIKEGKIKKDKNTSRIVREGNSWFEFADGQKTCIDEEIPFEIPDNWSWVRLNELGDYKKGPFGSALTKSMFVPAGPNSIKVYEQKNAIQKNWTLGEYYIRKEYYEEKMSGFTVEGGDVIVSCAGTIGETYVMPDDIELGIINQALMRMKVYEPMNVDYFLMYFDYVIKATAREQSKGSAIKNIPPFAIFKRILFPMPPLSEQDRILSRLTEILLEVDKMG